MSLPNGWVSEPLVRHIEFPQGQVDPRRSPYRDWPLIAPDHIESNTGRVLLIQTAAEQNAISGKYAFKSGDVLYSKIRPYLRKATLATIEGLCSADMYPLRPRSSVDSRFLLALILGEEFSRFAEAVSMRSGFPKINREEFAEYEATLPPIGEQSRIADILDAADAAIRQTEAVIGKLRRMKAGLLHDLLTRGLDEQGRLRDPQRHPEQFKDSPLGRIPSNWNVMSLEEMTPPDAPIGYGIVQPGPYVEGGVPVLAIQDLEGDYQSGIHRCHASIDRLYARSRVIPNDILLSIKGTIGRIGLVPQTFYGNISRDLARIRPVQSISPSFLRHLLGSTSSQKVFQLIVVGTTRAELSIAPLRQATFPMPPRPEQERIAAQTEQLVNRLHVEERYLAKIKLQKRGLMHDLLTGRVRV